MFNCLITLYFRYETAHLSLAFPGCPIVDCQGTTVGHVDRVELQGGRFRVQGWAQAVKLRLVHGGAEAEMAPVLRRPDVASALGLLETVGFDLSIPAPIKDFARSAPPGLVITREASAPPVDPLSFPICIPPRARYLTRLTFLRDVAQSLPAIAGWVLTKDTVYRTRVINRLKLRSIPGPGLMEPGLFRMPEDPPDPAVPQNRITVVLPVYNAFDLLTECLDRVERHSDLPWRMILIEDKSTDARVLPFLRAWAAARDNVDLLENPENRGFIASVNRGLKQALAEGGRGDIAGEGPVVVLNSDALVPEGWATRLVRPFYWHENVATVTPMSNDAEIFSVPQICSRTVLRPGQGDAIDKAAQSFAPEALLSLVPTGVGFCMAMGRDWLAREPALDTAFGRGYGEEVDWCQKVARRGGRHLGLPGLFVEHRGGESFGSAEKVTLVAKNNMIVSQRYPEYDRQVQDFIAADPLRTARLALALAWAGSFDPESDVPVYMAHAMGGGADHWLEQQIAEDLEMGRPSVILRVGGLKRFQIEVVSPQGRCIGQTETPELVTNLLAVLPRRRVVYSCGVGDPDPAALPGLLRGLLRDGDRAELLFHDFFPLSPAYTLLDNDGVYRGPVVPPRADPAHTVQRLDGTPVSLAEWQAFWKVFAEQADLIVFSNDSAEQVAAVWPDLKGRISVRPHSLRNDVPSLPAPAPDAPPVLAILGNIGKQKGAGVAQRLALLFDDIRENHGEAPRLVLIGNIDPTYILPPSTVLHGSYAVQDLPDLAARHGITHWLIPSIWPETFCYTVHEALATGLPVMAFALGAQGETVAQAENGVLLPFDPEADLAQKVLEALAPRLSKKL